MKNNFYQNHWKSDIRLNETFGKYIKVLTGAIVKKQKKSLVINAKKSSESVKLIAFRCYSRTCVKRLL